MQLSRVPVSQAKRTYQYRSPRVFRCPCRISTAANASFQMKTLVGTSTYQRAPNATLYAPIFELPVAAQALTRHNLFGLDLLSLPLVQ